MDLATMESYPDKVANTCAWSPCQTADLVWDRFDTAAKAGNKHILQTD